MIGICQGRSRLILKNAPAHGFLEFQSRELIRSDDRLQLKWTRHGILSDSSSVVAKGRVIVTWPPEAHS